MVAAFIIVFREILEAALIVGVVLAATRGVAGRALWVSCGVAGGIAGACIVAACADFLSDLAAGAGQDLFNAAVLLAAVAMLTWHNVWMARHGRALAQEARALAGGVASGARPLYAVALICVVAVMREGSEIVLFLYGVALSGDAAPAALAVGAALGLGVGALVGALLYGGLIAIPMRYFFATTTWLIALLAAGMAAQAIRFLAQAGIVTALESTAWNTSWLLSDSGVAGAVLRTLIGYADRPSWMQVVAYVAVLAVTVALMRLVAAPRAADAV